MHRKSCKVLSFLFDLWIVTVFDEEDKSKAKKEFLFIYDSFITFDLGKTDVFI